MDNIFTENIRLADYKKINRAGEFVPEVVWLVMPIPQNCCKSKGMMCENI